MSRRKRLDERQLHAIVELARPKRDTYEQIAEKVGVSAVTLYKWRQEDHFNEEIKKQVLRNSVGSLADVYEAIPRHIIEEGNAAMLRTFLQSLGMLTEKVEVSDTGSGVDIDAMRAKVERMKDDKGSEE